LLLWWDGYLQEAQLFLLLALLLWYKHRGNIARLLDGTETKIGH
jgi:glycerol-3-phosphate acyltransferase PlsY